MIVVEALLAAAPADSLRDPVVLAWADRARTRQKVTTQGGRSLAIKLATGTRLLPGAVLFAGDGWHVEVEAAPEEVWVVRAPDHRQLLRVAWEIGNRHFPVDLGDDEVAVLYDHTLAELWSRLGVPATRERRPFLAEMRPRAH